MTTKLSPEYQSIYRNNLCQNLRHALERYEEALEINLDGNAISNWQKKVTELTSKLQEIDGQKI